MYRFNFIHLCQQNLCENQDAELDEENANKTNCNKTISRLNDGNCNISSYKKTISTMNDPNSESLVMPSSTNSDTAMSSSNIQSSSPSHVNLNSNGNNINGLLRKNALKAALSLDPSTLCRGNIPYEKIAFSSPSNQMNNTGSMELTKVNL